MSHAVTAKDAKGVNFARLVRSEYIKLRTLRSTWVLLIVTVVILVGISALFAFAGHQSAGSKGAIPESTLHTAPVTGLTFGQLIVASFGAVMIGGEYASGMIRSTMTAAPKRLSALLAKVLVLAVTALVLGIVAGVAGWAVAQPILASKNLDFAFTTDGVPGIIAGLGLYLMCAALMGMAIGFLLRNSAGAIVTTLALLLIVPIIFQLIPLDAINNMSPYLPSQAGQEMTQISTSGDKFNQWQGGLIMGAWAFVLLVAASIRLKSSDV
ncbi:ABC transporter permease [Spelaeicoccus albus]|uniref:ABC-type transport system involved in multi-copper enzyme maturation permease subunit n=1 Tax=Spelaeicoccus albus TaxID=1280376 RepID=A0A7Z0D2B0_9MICO|nr:ABC transporter permease [Spelaeicoccus albus]NYI67561.1 ABC-type transport system involved in multi-copper enzyme maturation permease subunit [Spelaeicoccus albus]